MNKKTKIAFFILGFLAIGQVLWWAHLLIDQQILIAQLEPDFHEKTKHFNRMILAETAFFLFFWSLSLWYTYRSYKEQLSLRKAHNSFLGGISHELKTPIANIQICLETLARPDIDKNKVPIYVERAQKALESLLNQVENILTFTAIDSLSPKKEQFQIKDLVEQEIKVLQQNGKILNRAVQVHIPQGLIVNSPILASQLVIKNILENAIKYSSRSSKKDIYISGKKTDRKIFLTIRDHGIGMTKEEIEASTKPFWRSERAIKEALPGTGMGLTLSQEIASRSQIQIHLESAGLNQGVEATIIWESL